MTAFHTGRLIFSKYLIILNIFVTACVGLPENVTPVADFKLERYLGTWYEIARLDHSFERGLTRVTTEYSLRDDGGIRVINRGYHEKYGKWKVVEGKAYFVNHPQQGFLKISFFGPFYGSYIVFELDHQGYQYSVVSGPDKNYLWILARNPNISIEARDKLIARAKALGFNTENLIFVEQNS